MRIIKNFLKTTLITLCAILSLNANNNHLSHHLHKKVKSASIYLKQRHLFAKVITQSLWNYATGNSNNHILIEKKLAEKYACIPQPTQESINNDVHNLYSAIIKNQPASITPRKFLLGASSSAYQNEGNLDHNSAAARFYAKNNISTAGDAIDFYNRFEIIIKQLKQELHINSYRISLAWNRIEPEQGIFNQEALEFYRTIINLLLHYDIKPIIVLHHYDVPTWFEDLQGFELEENGKIFQRFCLMVYTQLAEELSNCLISLCNAPEGPAFKGYFTGEGTPGEKNNIQKTHTVIANMYYELVDTALHIKEKYNELKKTNPQLLQPSIGTQINVVLIDPLPSTTDTWKNKLACAFGSTIGTYIQSGGTYNFLVNGQYCMYTPDAQWMGVARGINIYRYHPNAHKAFDWIGVNIYSNRFVKGTKPVTHNEFIEEDEERYTDNPNYRNYPEGIYRAVKLITEKVAAPLGKYNNNKPLPIIVTENGIATKDDDKRTRYFQRALTTITELINDGYPVIGYLPWTSHDNYEWPTPENPQGFNTKCYGFFSVNFDKESSNYLSSTLKKGSYYFADFAKTFFAYA